MHSKIYKNKFRESLLYTRHLILTYDSPRILFIGMIDEKIYFFNFLIVLCVFGSYSRRSGNWRPAVTIFGCISIANWKRVFRIAISGHLPQIRLLEYSKYFKTAFK